MFRYFCLGLGLLLSLNTFVYAAGLKVKLVSITSPVLPGGTVTLVIATEPGAACTGQRQGHFGNEITLPLSNVGSNGRLQWSWPIRSGQHPVGIRTVHITCTMGNRRGSLGTVFNVRL
jgi:hypothetical protein